MDFGWTSWRSCMFLFGTSHCPILLHHRVPEKTYIGRPGVVLREEVVSCLGIDGLTSHSSGLPVSCLGPGASHLRYMDGGGHNWHLMVIARCFKTLGTRKAHFDGTKRSFRDVMNWYLSTLILIVESQSITLTLLRNNNRSKSINDGYVVCSWVDPKLYIGLCVSKICYAGRDKRRQFGIKFLITDLP